MPLVILNAKSMVSINKYEYYYVQSQNSIMRSNDNKKIRKKLEDKLSHFDNLLKEVEKYQIKKISKENFKIFATNSIIAVVNELDINNKRWYIKELKKRKIAKNIKIRNLKQFIKRIVYELKY